MTILYLSIKYTDSFVNERISFIYTDNVIKKGAAPSFLNVASAVVCVGET